jgi:HK97 family phage major capsid protein
MGNILAFKEKRAKAWEDLKAFLDSRSKDGALSAEDAAVYDKMETDIVNMGKDIDRLERQHALDLELSKPDGKPITNQPTNGGCAKTGRASGEYKAAFWNAIRNKSSHEIQNTLQIGVDTDGGYLAPDEFERTLIEALEEENIFRSLARIINTESGNRNIPLVTTKGTAQWMDENEKFTESDVKFGKITLGAYKLGTMIRVTHELLNDSVFDIAQYIAKEFGRRMGAAEEDAFFNGDGGGKPTGVINDAEVGVTAASAAVLTTDELIDLYHSLRAPYRRKAAFIMNDATVKAIRKLKDANGQYLWQPSIKEGAPDTILSRPIKTSQYAPVIGEGSKPVLFGDFSYYWIADRQGRIFQRLNEKYADYGQIGFLTYQRVDGKLILPEAVKALQMK